MTWDAIHNRDDVLRRVMAVAENRRDGRLPWDEVTGVASVFDGPADLVGALQMRWHARLSGAIERELSEQPWDLEQAVVHAWRRATGEMPGLRAVLDAYADEPFMERARAKEWALLATASGLTGMGDPQAARVGREVERRARAISVETAPPMGADATAHRGFLRRLRHALAA
jgi:hypothetical protein